MTIATVAPAHGSVVSLASLAGKTVTIHVYTTEVVRQHAFSRLGETWFAITGEVVIKQWASGEEYINISVMNHDNGNHALASFSINEKAKYSETLHDIGG